ncbi:carboxymuconolactone decarboxylase family protein [Shewanella sp. YIC-542]|uniref:carboxymuconolactone decarboxylase family protein n=1 Tax=Shewanella mytili TaxID=3377111 RepID=UPI00398EE772
MERLTKCTLENADALAKPILQEIKAKYGVIPNFFSALGISGAVMQGYLAFEQTIEDHCLLSEAQRELISLAVGNYNGCHYCVSGHTFSSKHAGLTKAQCVLAQQGKAEDPTDQILLDTALSIMKHKGQLPDSQIAAFKEAGLSEQLLMQVCAWTGINNFSNWVNNIVQPKIDFPKVELQQYTA